MAASPDTLATQSLCRVGIIINTFALPSANAPSRQPAETSGQSQESGEKTRLETTTLTHPQPHLDSTHNLAGHHDS